MKKMGRPKGDNNKDHVCTIRLDEQTYRRLLTYCEKINEAKSTAIRNAINQMIENQDK